MTAPDEREFQRQARRVEALVRALEACPDAGARENARELVRALLDLHAGGLARLLELVGKESGRPTVERIGRDGLVGGLLQLHGLHPVPVEERVEQALARVRPRLRNEGAAVELVGTMEGVVRLRLRGDPTSHDAIRAAVEDEVIEAAPDVAAVEFEEAWDVPVPGRVPLPLLVRP